MQIIDKEKNLQWKTIVRIGTRAKEEGKKLLFFLFTKRRKDEKKTKLNRCVFMLSCLSWQFASFNVELSNECAKQTSNKVQRLADHCRRFDSFFFFIRSFRLVRGRRRCRRDFVRMNEFTGRSDGVAVVVACTLFVVCITCDRRSRYSYSHAHIDECGRHVDVLLSLAITSHWKRCPKCCQVQIIRWSAADFEVIAVQFVQWIKTFYVR